jgi:hypothetical protein
MYAARIAFITWSRSNPISMIWATVASIASPNTIVLADESTEGAAPEPLDGAAEGAGAGAAAATAAAGAVGAMALGAASGVGSAAAFGFALLTMTTNMSDSATPYSLSGFPSSSTLPLWITLLTGAPVLSFSSTLA